MSYSSEVLADSPTGYWKLDDTSGTTTVDSSGNSQNGTYFNAPTLSATPLITVATAVTFAAASSQSSGISPSPSTFFDPPSSSFSIEFWVKTSQSAAVDPHMISSYDASSHQFFKVTLNNSTGQLVFTVAGHVCTGTTVVNDGVARHIVCTYDGTTMKIYLNGVLDGSLVSSFSPGAAASLFIAQLRNSGVSSNFLTGTVDEVAYYKSVALSSARITAHYSAGSGVGPQTLAGSSGITSSGAFGSGSLSFLQILTGSGIASGNAFGTGGSIASPRVVAGAAGISSSEGFGSGSVFAAFDQTITGSGIPSGQAFGVGSIVASIPVPVDDCDLVLEPWENVEHQTITVGGGTPSARTLSTNTGSGLTLTLSLTSAPTAGELVQVFTAAVTGPESFFETQAIASVVDSKSGSWSTDPPHAIVGNIGDASGSGSAKNALNICESYVRIGGVALEAGDTVTVSFLSGNTFDPAETVGAVVALLNVGDHYAQDDYSISETNPGSTYSNGDSFPSSGDGTNILWLTDLGTTGPPLPVSDCCGFSVHAIFGGGASNTFTPVNGTTLVTVNSTNLALSIVLDSAVAEADGRWEPGGSWASSGSILCSNYRLAELVAETTEVIDLCDLDLEPEAEDCDLVLVPFAPRVIGSTGTGRLLVGEAGIPSAEVFGAGSVQTILGGEGQDGLGTAGIVSGEVFGSGGIISAGATRLIGAHGISSGGLFGVGGSINAGNVLVLSGGGIVSAETFGLTGKVIQKVIGSTGIPSGGGFGSTGILHFTTGIKGASGIASAGVFGANGKMTVKIKGLVGIPSPQSGTRFMSLTAGTTQVGGTATAEIDSDGFGTNGSIS